MTTAVEAGIGLLESELLPDIRAHADALDRDEDTSRRSFAALGAAGLLGLGAPSSLKSHCTGPAALDAEAGQRTGAGLAPVGCESAPAPTSAATTTTPTRRRALTAVTIAPPPRARKAGAAIGEAHPQVGEKLTPEAERWAPTIRSTGGRDWGFLSPAMGDCHVRRRNPVAQRRRARQGAR